MQKSESESGESEVPLIEFLNQEEEDCRDDFVHGTGRHSFSQSH